MAATSHGNLNRAEMSRPVEGAIRIHRRYLRHEDNERLGHERKERADARQYGAKSPNRSDARGKGGEEGEEKSNDGEGGRRDDAIAVRQISDAAGSGCTDLNLCQCSAILDRDPAVGGKRRRALAGFQAPCARCKNVPNPHNSGNKHR